MIGPRAASAPGLIPNVVGVIGKLRDLTARLGVEHPVVHRLVIGSRRGLTHLVPWTAVATFEPSEIQLRDVGPLNPFLIGRRELPLEPDELLLVRAVLDTQIIDVVGHRRLRVADVVITRLADGRLEVAAVDVGGAAVWRRLGLQWLSQRFARRPGDWKDLHLTSARGHDVHLATTTAAVHQLDAQGLAELLTRLDLTSPRKSSRQWTGTGRRRSRAGSPRGGPAHHAGSRAARGRKVIDELPEGSDAVLLLPLLPSWYSSTPSPATGTSSATTPQVGPPQRSTSPSLPASQYASGLFVLGFA